MSPDNQLTHPHAVLFNRQDLSPVTFVNPTKLNPKKSDMHTIPRKEVADSFLFKHQRKQMQDAEKRKMINQRKREHYREMMKDPEKRELTKQRQRNECKTPKKEN
ncbi:hypothetical protein [Endozoicomonas sp. ALB091]|uniref:hypothetical protein n=1 Tax=Endozoicomonas sp. ALB091 TaxID=3403073 RepID=UPI003BB6DB67